MTDLILTGSDLTLELAVRAVVAPDVRLSVAAAALERVAASRAIIEQALQDGRPVYGVNTGFGKLQSQTVAPEDLRRLQRNLLLSHAVGVGKPLSVNTTRLMLLLRINAVIRGHSGVSLALVNRLVAIWNAGLAPIVPEQGSVGASGDLAPLAHLALTVIGEGEAMLSGERLPSAEALTRAGLEPTYELTEKEGLALLNGTQQMTAIGLVSLARADRLLRHADLAAAMTFEALRALDTPIDPRIHAARPHPGQAQTACNLTRLLEGSELVERQVSVDHVQDAYSLRCAPQVHGACRDAMSHVRDVLVREANSTTDNPLVFVDDGTIVSGGNFHGEPVAMACDYLAIAAAELASISERRIESIVNPDLSGLPAFLAAEPGVCSGFMMAQVTAAALVSENKTLAHPASVDSVPTSANQEDHVSMGPIAARKARDIIENVRNVLAIEILAAAHAIELRRPQRASPAIEAVVARLKDEVGLGYDDSTPLANDIAATTRLVRSCALLDAAEAASGPLVGLHPA